MLEACEPFFDSIIELLSTDLGLVLVEGNHLLERSQAEVDDDHTGRDVRVERLEVLEDVAISWQRGIRFGLVHDALPDALPSNICHHLFVRLSSGGFDRSIASSSRRLSCRSSVHCESCDAVAVVDGSREEKLGLIIDAHVHVQVFSILAVDLEQSSEQRLVVELVLIVDIRYLPFVVEEFINLILESARHSEVSLAAH